METENIIIPKQLRSIEKKKKILETGFRLFSEKGYYNTNTAEIAKQAGVSTGILYRYFTDKRAIYLEIFQTQLFTLYQSLGEQIERLDSQSDFAGFIGSCIEYVISTHTSSASIHEEFEAMAHYDKEIAGMFDDIKEKAISTYADYLKKLGFNPNYTHEKIHLIFDLIESYCHEVKYNKETCKDYNYLKQIIIDTCLFVLRR